MTDFITVPHHITGVITAERVSEHFAITPLIGSYGEDQPQHLSGGTCLVHIPTGRIVSYDKGMDMRQLTQDLEALDIEWATLTKFTSEQVETVKKVMLSQWDRSDDDEGWPWPEWAGDETQPATSLLARTLDNQAESHERFRKVNHLAREVVRHLPDEHGDLGKKVDAHLLTGWSMGSVNEFGVAYLLAVLQRVDPAAADRAARELVSQWDAGDSMGELAYQWRDELAKGQPLTLFGFPDTALEADDA